MLDGKDRAVDLFARLQRIAAVDEQRRATFQHDGNARGAGKSGEPFEPLLRCRHIFVLLPVGARQHEAVEPAPRKLGPQSGQPRGDLRAGRFVYVEGLELCFEHGGTLWGGGGPTMRGIPWGREQSTANQSQPPLYLIPWKIQGF